VGLVSSRGRICIYSEFLYPVMVPGTASFAGGSETQVAQLARGLLERGFEITVVSRDFGQPSETNANGIRVLKSFDAAHGWPVLRFFHPRLTRAASALWRADAEVYYATGAGMASGLCSDIARLRGAGYVNHCAHDTDVTRAGLFEFLNARDRWWYRRAISRADALLAQTEWQRDHLRSEFGLGSEVLPNVVRIPEVAATPEREGTVIWLGTYKAMKRPDWFTRLAREIPEARFVMAGVIPPPPLSGEHWERAQAAARECANLEVLGYQNATDTARLFGRAEMLVHTAPVEGFSNVLLEAWAAGLPTVSCVDPDGLVTRHGLGGTANSFEELREAVLRLLHDSPARKVAGCRAREYVTAHHAPGIVLDRLAAIMDRVVAGIRSRRGR
jgi:glycosyltransferase involved in cell wall biosynthesis